MTVKFSFHSLSRSFKLSERLCNLWQRGGRVPKRIALVSIMIGCSLCGGVIQSANAQALVPHTLQLDTKKLEQQGLSLAQEAAQIAQFQPTPDMIQQMALPRAKLASQLAPNEDRVWFLLGGLYLQTKSFDNAVSALERAKSLNPKNGDILFALGSTYFQQEEYQKAVGYYESGIKLKPKDHEGWFDLANANYMLGKHPQAISQYEKAISYNNKFWPAVNNIGLILYEKGDVSGAMKKWEEAINKAEATKQPSAEPELALAVALYAKGDRQKSIAMGEKALRTDGRYAQLDFLKQNLWGKRLLLDAEKFLQLPRIQTALQDNRKLPLAR